MSLILNKKQSNPAKSKPTQFRHVKHINSIRNIFGKSDFPFYELYFSVYLSLSIFMLGMGIRLIPNIPRCSAI